MQSRPLLVGVGRAGAVGLAIALATPAASSAQVVEPVSVSKSVTVPAGAARSLTLTCPRTAIALSGAATEGLAARSSIPAADIRRWRFRFRAGAQAGRGAAVLRCVRLRLPPGMRRAVLRIGTARRPDIDVPPRRRERVTLRCRRDQIATGWGLERRAGDLEVAAAVPGPRAWAFELVNRGTGAATGALRIRCLSRTQRATTGERHSFASRVAAFTETATAGATVLHSCRRSEVSLAGGAALDPNGGPLLSNAYPSFEHGGAWSFAGSGSGPATTTLVCLSLRTRFR